MRPRTLVVIAAVFLAPIVLAHGDEEHLDDQLVRNGQRLMVGEFGAAQPGPLLIVPFMEAPLACGSRQADFVVPLSGGAGVTILSNATHILAEFDRPTSGYVAFALDTADAVRALLLMEEQAVSLHVLAAHGVPGGSDRNASPELRVGLLGIPYRIPGASMHSLGHDLEGGGIAMQYGSGAATVAFCEVAPDRIGFLIERALRPQTLAAGGIVHAVALYDPVVSQFLPRPVDSTEVLQANLYLARPGEDPGELQDALEGGAGAVEAAAAASLTIGLLWVSRP